MKYFVARRKFQVRKGKSREKHCRVKENEGGVTDEEKDRLRVREGVREVCSSSMCGYTGKGGGGGGLRVYISCGAGVCACVSTHECLCACLKLAPACLLCAHSPGTVSWEIC